MKKALAFIFLLLIGSGCTVSKRTLYLDLPPETTVKAYPIDLSAYEEKYKNYDGVYLDHTTKYEHSGTKDNFVPDLWKFTLVSSFEYLILNTDSRLSKSTRLRFKPDNFYLRLISPDGDMKYYKQDSLVQEKEADGTEYYTIIYPEVAKGTIIEVGFEKTFKMSAYWAQTDYDNPLQFTVPCENLEFSFAYPDWWDIQVKNIRNDYLPDYQTISDAKNKKTIISCIKKDVPAITDEPYSPEYKMIVEYIQFMITDMVMSSGGMHRYETWDEMFKGFYELYINYKNAKINDLPKADSIYQDQEYTFTEFVNHLFEIENAQTDGQKIQAILDYVQESIEMTYEDKNGNVNKILSAKEGNVFDITVLAHRMLKEAGYENEFSLIHSAEDGYFDSYYINSDQLYIPGIKLTLNNSLYVLFPAFPDLPYNIIPDRFKGQKAVSLIGYNDINFWKTPIETETENSLYQNLDIEFTSDGSTIVSEELIFKGYDAYSIRMTLNFTDSTEIETFITNLVAYEEGEVKDLSYEIINQDEVLEDFIIRYQYSIDNLITITPEEIIVQTSGFFIGANNINYRYNKDLRTNPIEILNKEKFVQDINLTYPDHWKLITEVIPNEYENIFGVLKWSSETDENSTRFIKELTLKQTYQPKSMYPEFLKIYGDDNEFNLPTLIFSNKIEESKG